MAEQLMTLAYDNGINLFDTAEVYAAGKYVSLLVGKRGVATGPLGAPFPVTLVPRGPACASPSARVSFSWALDTGHLLNSHVLTHHGHLSPLVPKPRCPARAR